MPAVEDPGVAPASRIPPSELSDWVGRRRAAFAAGSPRVNGRRWRFVLQVFREAKNRDPERRADRSPLLRRDPSGDLKLS